MITDSVRLLREREHNMRLRFMGNLKDDAGKKGLYSCQ